MWTGIEKMRKENVAAVDTMGCDQVHEEKASKADRAYHTLVSLMLSAQTKDEVTHATTDFLVREKNLSVKTIVKTNTDDLNIWISKVGFHNKKAVYIKKATQIIHEEHDGIVPNDYAALIALPGVGPKMAHLLLQHAYDKVNGVSVDTHVHRISGRLGWTKDAKTPGHTADQLEDWLPKDKWVKVNHLLVGFGQTICKPIGPRCYNCGIMSLCPMKGKTIAPELRSKSKKKAVKESDTESSIDSNSLVLDSDEGDKVAKNAPSKRVKK